MGMAFTPVLARSTESMCRAVMRTPTYSNGTPIVLFWGGSPSCQLAQGHGGNHRDPLYRAEWSGESTSNQTKESRDD